MTALLQLFWSFFQVGLFSFGGGYAAMPLIQAQVVDLHGWLNMTEFADIITISQMTPGPIAINSATFVGMRIAGVAGALVATVGCVLPSCIVSLLLAKLYLKYRSLDLIHGALGGLPHQVFLGGIEIIHRLVQRFAEHAVERLCGCLHIQLLSAVIERPGRMRRAGDGS